MTEMMVAAARGGGGREPRTRRSAPGSGLKPFVTAARTIRKRKAEILAAVRLEINNAQHEGPDRRVRLIVNGANGFQSAKAALGLVMLTLGPINHVLPRERVPVPDP